MNNGYVYKRITFEGKEAYYKKIGPEHIFRRFNGIAVSTAALYSMEEDYLIVIEYEGKTEDCYFITYIRTFKEEGIEYDNNGDIQKVVPLWRFKKRVIRKKSNMSMREIKTRVKETQDKLTRY